MAPLKRYFTGESTPPSQLLCNIQPCIRTVDIQTVGDRHHLTLFEMLGSWSIGNYFKQGAIELAFKLLTDYFHFDPAHLYATVFSGHPSLPIPPDELSGIYWEKVGLRKDHIVPLGLDNFWGPTGDFGPCGPCTEVFFDTGAAYGPTYKSGSEFDTENRYLEIWNAGVFMQYDKRPDNTYLNLPILSVDTGSGLERLTMAKAKVPSVYETDLLQPIMQSVVSQLVNKNATIVEQRLLVDHLRATTFILAENVRPGKTGSSYIPRRLIRRCIALTIKQDCPDFDFATVINEIITSTNIDYPHLNSQREEILEQFNFEQKKFSRTVKLGLAQLDKIPHNAPFQVSGKKAFQLFSSYGLPLDIIQDFAKHHKGTVDNAGFQSEFLQHQKISGRSVLS